MLFLGLIHLLLKPQREDNRHGFYAQRFTADENRRLDTQPADNVQAEINLLRVCIGKLQNELNLEPAYLTDAQENETRDPHYLNQLNTLANMMQSLATLERTQHLIHGRGGKVQDAIEDALNALRLEFGI